MPIEGKRRFSDGNQAMQVIDFSRDIMYIQPIETPLLTLILAMGMREETISPEFKVPEMNYLGFRTTVNGAHPAGATSITLTDASFINPGDVLYFTNTAITLKEANQVISKAGNVVTVVRDIGGTGSGAALSGGEDARVIGTAVPDGGEPVPAIDEDYTEVSNYLQEFSTVVQQTYSQIASVGTPGSEMEEAINRAGARHKRKIEAAYLFGKKDLKTISGEKYYYTNGIINRITSFVTDVNGTLTKPAFHNFLKNPFSYGNKTKYLFCGNGVYEAIHYWADTRLTADMLRFQGDQGTFGYRIARYMSPYGDVIIIRHPMLVNHYDGHGILVDMDMVKERYFPEFDNILRENIGGPKPHSIMHEWYSFCGLEFRNEQCHGILMRVTGGA